jgi:transmembrane sensor
MSESVVGRGDLAVRARRDEIDSKAREWMSYLYSGEMTEQGRSGFQAWLAESPDHRAAFQMLNDIWISLDRVHEIENGLLAAPQDSSGITQPFNGPTRSAWGRFARIAGSLALAAGVAALAILVTLHVTDPADERHLASEIGEIRALGLADGTQLVLRADSEIFASISREGRSVTIERGGAYFDVSREENRPFVVSAGDIDIRVRGTAFDVLKGPSSVTVSVTHGRVAVSNLTNQSRGRTVELNGGQQLTVESDGTFGAVTEFDPRQVLGWREGRFSYLNARLEDIIADINRYRTVKIAIEDEALKDLRITTMFRAENTDQMLAGIEATEPVTIIRSPSSITIQQRQQP